jgi:D-arabinose 1-dehydrogenase-like Zn-dependent alcohol dehydrogenase
MRAVVLYEYGGPEKLKFEDDVPEPQISGGTVLIAAAAASVNPIDWKLRSGMRQKDFPLSFPAILGRDVSGAPHLASRENRMTDKTAIQRIQELDRECAALLSGPRKRALRRVAHPANENPRAPNNNVEPRMTKTVEKSPSACL